ncbi:MAG TPA: ABC transporter permease [Candidatus Dormibacteraeota bacterium]|nr:ABC transporter permease [Candidatus Dormibacteraeota bacterium]
MAAVTTGAPARGARLSFRIPRTRGASLAFYIVRRVLWMVPVVLFVITITFVLMHLAPGSPWDRAGGRQLSQAVTDDLNVKYGLDKPLWNQFLIYLWNVAHFDFGLSYQYQNQTVTHVLLESWPATLTIGALAFAFIVPLGIGLGVIAALRQNSAIDYIAVGFGTLGASVPNFVIGIFLIIVFSVEAYHLSGGNIFLPSGGFGWNEHLILPVITLAVLPTAYIARMARSSTLDVLRQDYVRTAWAKGLRQRLVITRHVVKNSLIPVLSSLGSIFALLITGSVIVETVFAIPGIGRSFVVAVSSRDYPMILATTILFSVVIAIVNLVIDLLYTVIDPRVRLS